jgi:hypothetical protein
LLFQIRQPFSLRHDAQEKLKLVRSNKKLLGRRAAVVLALQ